MGLLIVFIQRNSAINGTHDLPLFGEVIDIQQNILRYDYEGTCLLGRIIRWFLMEIAEQVFFVDDEVFPE